MRSRTLLIATMLGSRGAWADHVAAVALVAGFFMRGKMAGMSDDDDDDYGDDYKKREIRWPPYLMFALGALFLILGIANLSLIHEPDPWNPWPHWWSGAPTSPAPFSLFLGIILIGAGVPALKHQAE